jgi:5-methylcytosine-specific restriction endonuclease McrA
MAAYSKTHAKANPENVRDRAEQRRIRVKSAGKKWTAQDVALMRKAQRDLCAYCRIPLDGAGHVDHMTPVAKLGTNKIKNLVLACFQCNTEKHAKTAKEYFAWRARRDLPVRKLAYAYRRLYGRSSAP